MLQQIKKFMKYFVPASRYQVAELNAKLSKIEKLSSVDKQLREVKTILKGFQKLEKSMLRLMPRPSLKRISFHIIDHCNLNCKHCNVFSPIASKSFVPFETIRSDLNQLSVITQKKLARIIFHGGETLLHPDSNFAVALERSILGGKLNDIC